MQNKFCLPIIKSSKDEVLNQIKNNPDYDYFEIWLDYIENLDIAFVQELIAEYEKKLVFLFRRQNLEHIKMPWEKRVEVLSILNNSTSLLDLDFSLQKPELEYVKDSNLNISKIVSYHNYEKTPDYRELAEIIAEMEEYNPFIVKIAAMCNSDNDPLRLMNLLLELKKEKRQFIVLGMGEFGKITRVYGLLQGNAMNFAPKNLDESSAPGQISKSDLEEISKIINK